MEVLDNDSSSQLFEKQDSYWRQASEQEQEMDTLKNPWL